MKEKQNKYIVKEELARVRLDKAITMLDVEISRMTARKIIRRRKCNSKSEKQKKHLIKLSKATK